jgi:oligopeptide/dipeptide ABC transporter ATP-binding protein
MTVADQLAGPLFEIRELSVVARPRGRKATPATIVDRVSLAVSASEIVGVVGESGSGKSITMLASLDLLPMGVERSGGEALYRGRALTELKSSELRALRGNDIALIPPDAHASLSPVARVGKQVVEVIRVHQRRSKKEANDLALAALERAGLPDPVKQARSYPHELSGGMLQRVAIALALANDPSLLIADEPTSALDVSVQAQILALLLEIRDVTRTAIVLISHDLAAVSEICDRIVVMYSGVVVETGVVSEVLARQRHPYTRALLQAIPPLTADPPTRLPIIPGTAPAVGAWPRGCRFAERCSLRRKLGDPPRCTEIVPVLEFAVDGHGAACHFSDELGQAVIDALPVHEVGDA